MLKRRGKLLGIGAIGAQSVFGNVDTTNSAKEPAKIEQRVISEEEWNKILADVKEAYEQAHEISVDTEDITAIMQEILKEI